MHCETGQLRIETLKAVRTHYARELAQAVAQVGGRSGRSAQSSDESSDGVADKAHDDEFLADNFDRIVAALPKRLSLNVREPPVSGSSLWPHADALILVF